MSTFDRDGLAGTNSQVEWARAGHMNFGAPSLPIYLEETDTDVVDDNSRMVMICDVCKNRLNKFTGPDGEIWVHSRAFDAHDHDPEPRLIERSKATGEICDFCSSSDPTYWKYVGDRVRSAAGNTVQDYGTVWGACEACSALIDSGDLDGMARRNLRLNPQLTKGLDRRETEHLRSELLRMWTAYLETVYDREYVGPKREPAKLSAKMMPKLQLGLLKFWSQPGLFDRINRGRAAAQHGHSMPGVHVGQEDQFSVRYPDGAPMDPDGWRNHTNHLKAGIEGAELFWIAANFTRLAIMAGKDFDKLVISREELPAKFGIMLFEEPIGEIARPYGAAGIRGVSWTLVPGGIWIVLYIQGEDADPTIDAVEMRDQQGYLMSMNTGSGFAFDNEMPTTQDPGYQWINTIFATWFLLAQPGVTETTVTPPDKKLARSYQRAYNRRIPDVQLVDLRRQPHRSTGDRESVPGRKLTVRVYRKGHWKRQAYGPKRGMRKTIYISPYIAGPEGAPLAQRPTTVKVLR